MSKTNDTRKLLQRKNVKRALARAKGLDQGSPEYFTAIKAVAVQMLAHECRNDPERFVAAVRTAVA